MGGGAGAVIRYWMSGAVQRVSDSVFPVGTMTVNILGCLLIGFLMSFFEERFQVDPVLRLFLTVGFLGGLTTYSTFSFETVALLKDGQMLYGFLNILITTSVCLLSVWIGSIIGKLL